MCYQGTFAIITAALISGAIVERMRFSAYVRVHHAVGARRLLRRSRTGSGAAAGSPRWARSTSPAAPSCTSTPASRRWSPRSSSASGATIPSSALLPHNVPFTLLGAGAALVRLVRLQRRQRARGQRHRRAGVHDDDARAGGDAGRLDAARRRSARGKPTAVGAATAIVVGLVAITPAAGFVGPMSAIALGAHRRRSRATSR